MMLVVATTRRGRPSSGTAASGGKDNISSSSSSCASSWVSVWASSAVGGTAVGVLVVQATSTAVSHSNINQRLFWILENMVYLDEMVCGIEGRDRDRGVWVRQITVSLYLYLPSLSFLGILYHFSKAWEFTQKEVSKA